MSDLFTVNHKEAGGGFEPLPIGEYETVISDVKLEKSQGEKTKGADMLVLTMTVRDDVDQPGQKRKFFDNIIFAPSLTWKIQQFYKACQFEDGTKFTSAEDVAKAVAFRPIRIKNRHEKGNDDTIRDRVAVYLPSKVPYNGGASGEFDPFAVDSTPRAANPLDDDVPF